MLLLHEARVGTTKSFPIVLGSRAQRGFNGTFQSDGSV